MFESGFAVARTAVADKGFFSFLVTRAATAGRATICASVFACRVGSVPVKPVPEIVEPRLSGWSSSLAEASYSFPSVLVYAAVANAVSTRQSKMIHH